MEIISRKEAKDRGLNKYFTGKICCNGHDVERHAVSGSCVECNKAWQNTNYENNNGSKKKTYYLKNIIRTKEYYIKNKNRIKNRSTKFYSKNKAEIRSKQKEHWAKNKEQIKIIQAEYRARNQERLKKIRAERWERKRIKMAGRDKTKFCEICGNSGKIIVFDHCHLSGLFRGWLCNRCNTVLGLAKDNSFTLKKMAVYLDNFNSKLNSQNSSENVVPLLQ